MSNGNFALPTQPAAVALWVVSNPFLLTELLQHTALKVWQVKHCTYTPVIGGWVCWAFGRKFQSKKSLAAA